MNRQYTQSKSLYIISLIFDNCEVADLARSGSDLLVLYYFLYRLLYAQPSSDTCPTDAISIDI